MPKAPATPKTQPAAKSRLNAALWLRLAFWGFAFGGAAYGARQVQSFLQSDPRFEFRNLEIRGAGYTDKARIQAFFATDAHRSVFRIPLAERRTHLLAIDWVRTASIERIWPNRIVVVISERRPVAFARLQDPGSARSWLALIDDEGILLPLPARARFHLPVLSGVTEEQTDEDRRRRVEAMRRLIADLGPRAGVVSEINAAFPHDLRVVADVDGQGLELWLGDTNFQSRLTNFLTHYPEIKSHSETARIFDLRIDDRISTR